MDYREQRWQEILEGNRSWGLAENAGGNHDVFFAGFVLPLRWLPDEGRIEHIHEHRSGRQGTSFVDRVDVEGAVDLAD